MNFQTLEEIRKFQKTVLTPLTGIFTANIILAYLLNILSASDSPASFNYGSLFMASIAFMSLYLAWKKFYVQRNPNLALAWNFEANGNDGTEIKLKVFNSGDSPVYLKNMTYGYVRYLPEKEKVSMSNGETVGFDKDFLEPGEKISVDLGKNYLTRIREIRIDDVEGEDQIYEDEKIEHTLTKYENLYNLDSLETQKALQKGFQMLLDKVIRSTVYLGKDKFEDEFALKQIKEKLIDAEDYEK